MDEWRRLSIPSSPVPSSFVPLRSFFFVCARDNRFRGENYIENVDGWMDGRTDAWKEQEKAWKTREKEMRRGDRVENRDAGMRWSGMADDHTHTHTHTHTELYTRGNDLLGRTTEGNTEENTASFRGVRTSRGSSV